MAASGGLMELRAVVSSQVKKGSLKAIDNVVAWPVDPNKPFNHEVNFGKFCSTLNIFAACELCHYYEGRTGDVIDLSKTPAELGYRPRMTVYVRVRKTRDATTGASDALALRLTAEEEKLLRKLRNHVLPNMGPDDPCPLCSRVEQYVTDPNAVAARATALASVAAAAATPGVAAASIGGVRYRPEVGVQCGGASRTDEPFMPIAFGTAARLSEHQPNTMTGGPRSFVDPTRSTRHGGASGGGGSHSLIPSGGAPFTDIEGAIVDIKVQLERATRERDQLAAELKEMTKAKTRLEQWRASHRCDVSADVARLRSDHEALQAAMRELARGREDVQAMLQQRRSVGLGMRGVPFPYQPHKLAAPQLDPLSPSVRQLLSKALGAADGPAASAGAASVSGDSESQFGANPELTRRPSGGAGASDANVPDMTRDRAAGQCVLRVTSVAGDHFYVRRRVGSEVRAGRHYLHLLALDGTLTDEIYVQDLIVAGVDGPTGLRLETAANEFIMYMHPTERQRWLHWVYALAPFLGAGAPDLSIEPIPRNL
jgi:hypothetical protein